MNIFITSLLVGFSLVATHSEAQNISALSCSVQSNQLRNASSLQDQVVSAKNSTNLAITLGEDLGYGSYMTYVHAKLTYNAALPQALTVTANAEFSQIRETKTVGPLNAKLSLKSRVGRADMIVSISCEILKSEYLLVPAKTYPVDPIYSFQSGSTTLENYLKQLKAEPFSFHPAAADESEYLAKNYCIQGDASKFLAELKKLTLTGAIPGFWHADAMGRSQLLPQSLGLSSTGVDWSQPLESATCTASHIEHGVDEDQTPYDYSVCDNYQINELAPVALEIPYCK